MSYFSQVWMNPNNVLAVLSFFVALAGLWLAYDNYRKKWAIKKISYTLDKQVPTGGAGGLYTHSIVIKLRNVGAREILPADFHQPMSFHFTQPGITIHTASIDHLPTSQQPTCNPTAVTCPMFTLNSRASLEVKIELLCPDKQLQDPAARGGLTRGKIVPARKSSVPITNTILLLLLIAVAIPIVMPRLHLFSPSFVIITIIAAAIIGVICILFCLIRYISA